MKTVYIANALKTYGIQTKLVEDGVVTAIGGDIAVDEYGSSEIGASQACADEVDADENGIGKIRRLKVCAFELRIDDHGAREVGARKLGIAHFGVGELDLCEEGVFERSAIHIIRLELCFNDF